MTATRDELKILSELYDVLGVESLAAALVAAKALRALVDGMPSPNRPASETPLLSCTDEP